MEPGDLISMGALVGVVVAVIKAAWPGELNAKIVPLVVLAVSGAVVTAAWQGGIIELDSLYAGLAAWMAQAATAMGLRAATTTAIPAAGELPSRT